MGGGDEEKMLVEAKEWSSVILDAAATQSPL